MKVEPKWIVKFRRPLTSISMVRGSLQVGWRPVKPEFEKYQKLRYWDSKDRWWMLGIEMAYRYKTREAAERAAFNVIAKDSTLFGEVEVVEYVPISRPKR